MAYTVTINGYNCLSDWDCILVGAPNREMPTVKRYTVDIPYMDGVLDYTEALNGRPVYGNRTVSCRLCYKGDAGDFPEIYSTIASIVHNKLCEITFDDESKWYYVGRGEIGQEVISENGTYFDLTFDCEPFKYSSSPVIDRTIPGFPVNSGDGKAYAFNLSANKLYVPKIYLYGANSMTDNANDIKVIIDNNVFYGKFTTISTATSDSLVEMYGLIVDGEQMDANNIVNTHTWDSSTYGTRVVEIRIYEVRL